MANTLSKVFDFMRRKTRDEVACYQTDVALDVEKLLTTPNVHKVVWCTRECGTELLMAFDTVTDIADKHCYQEDALYILDYHKQLNIYLLDLDSAECKPVSKEDAIKFIVNM